MALVVAVVTGVPLLGLGVASLLQQFDSGASIPAISAEPSGTTPIPAQSTTAPPNQPPSAPPEPGPQEWQLPAKEWEPLPEFVPPDEIWAQLQGSALLREAPAVLTGCPTPTTIDTEEQYRAAVLQQWHCVHVAWQPMYQMLGWPTAEPPVEFFTGSGADSACGHLEAPAFYCSAEHGTVYFGTGHMEMAQDWDLSMNEMVNHEYGHHLQSLAGITDAKLQLEQTNEIERRAELQATCWSAAMTYNNEDVSFDGSDWDSWQQRLETMTIDGIHGSRESILHWGTRGLYATTLEDCNTWAVPAEDVS